VTGGLHLRLLAAAAVAVAVVVAVVFWLARSGDDTAAVGEPRSLATVRGDLIPRSPMFGERVVAEVVAVVDSRMVVPASLQVNARFDPYELAAPVEKDTAEVGRLLRIRYRYTLECLSEACTPSADTPVLELPATRVNYRYRGLGGRGSQTVRWPVLRVAARVEPAEVEAARWRADAVLLPAATYRIDPRLLAALLIAAALGLLALAAALVRALVGTRARTAAEVEVDGRPPLERALELARVATLNGGGADRRTALERVAMELSGLGLRDLADRARTIAWSRTAPSADDVDELARDARAAAGGAASS
jgi:hypothetical protein